MYPVLPKDEQKAFSHFKANRIGKNPKSIIVRNIFTLQIRANSVAVSDHELRSREAGMDMKVVSKDTYSSI